MLSCRSLCPSSSLLPSGLNRILTCGHCTPEMDSMTSTRHRLERSKTTYIQWHYKQKKDKRSVFTMKCSHALHDLKALKCLLHLRLQSSDSNTLGTVWTSVKLPAVLTEVFSYLSLISPGRYWEIGHYSFIPSPYPVTIHNYLPQISYLINDKFMKQMQNTIFCG